MQWSSGVTSHSPYVIERFTPENTFLLTRGMGGALQSMCVSDATGLKENDYKRYARRGLSECMLGKGVTIFDAESDGPFPKFGKFFQALGLKTFGFYDLKQRTPDEKKKFSDVLDVNWEHSCKGFEQMLAREVTVSRLRFFVQNLVASGVDAAHYGIPGALPTDDEAVRKLVQQLLSSAKGAGWVGSSSRRVSA